MKKIFLLLWFVLLGLFEVQAYQFEKNGIYYEILLRGMGSDHGP